jgi:hypothetical protein
MAHGRGRRPEHPGEAQADLEIKEEARPTFRAGRSAAVPEREGAELILIGADEDVTRELGVQLNPAHETAQTAEIFTNLHMNRKEHPVQPLFTGQWE